MTELIYVYAVLTEPVAVELRGIDHQPVRWVTGDGLAAAVSDVPAKDFDEEPLNANVRDMGWLGPHAIAHQDVNSRMFEAADAIVPLAFGSVFRDDDRVRQMLVDQQQALTERLDAVRGCAEWVVALHQVQAPTAVESPAIDELRGEIASSAPGRAHLLRRRLETLERDERRRLQSEAAAQLLDALRAVARDVYQEPLPSEAAEKPLLRASVLIPRQEESRFVDEVDRMRSVWPEPTYRLLLTGPWPPYRFAGLQREHV